MADETKSSGSIAQGSGAGSPAAGAPAIPASALGAGAAPQKPAVPTIETLKVERVEQGKVADRGLSPLGGSSFSSGAAFGNGLLKDAKSTAPKLAPQEELGVKIQDGLQRLSGLLGAIDGKLAVQNQVHDRIARSNDQIAQSNERLAQRLEAIPKVLDTMAENQRASLEVMRGMQRSLDAQGESTREQTRTLEKIPTSVGGLGEKVERQTAASDSLKESVEDVGKSVRSLADGSQRAQHTLLAEFRRAQDEHRRRLEELVDRERKTVLVVAALGVLVVVCLVLMLVRISGN